MPYPVFGRCDYVDSEESARAFLESTMEILLNCIHDKDLEIQELRAENENLKAELEKEKAR